MSVAVLQDTFNLTYQIDSLERAAKGGHLTANRVLEVGGALPRELVLGHYRAASWTAVDHRSAYSSALAGTNVGARTTVLEPSSKPATDGSYIAYDGDAATLPATFDGQFDVVISLATFEHVANLGAALSRMRFALKPRGILLAQVGPVWSGWRGHHVFRGHLGAHAEKSDDMLERLVPWQHLIMRPPDMESWLASRYGPEFAESAVHWIYESPRLNRLFFEDYVEIFASSGLTELGLQPNGARVPAGWQPTLDKLLTMRHPGRRAFDVDSFWATLGRSEPD
jgi:SAM-dependent methyltransferase